jgi:hypothetical protein
MLWPGRPRPPLQRWLAGAGKAGGRGYNRNTLNEPNSCPSELPMAVSGRRRFDDDKVVKYETAEKDFEVEVSRTLNKWCVTVYQMPDKQILVQDFFPERWKALARAQDFIRLLNQRKKKDEEGTSGSDDDY